MNETRRRAIRTLAEMELRDAARPTLREKQEAEIHEMVRIYGPRAESILHQIHRIEYEHVAYAEVSQ
jgi:hypothetical protein